MIPQARKMNISIFLGCVLLGGGVTITSIDTDIVDTTENPLADIAHVTDKEAFNDDAEGTTENKDEANDAESDDCESHILQR